LPRLCARSADDVIVRKLGEMLASEHQRSRIVPTGDRGPDLFLLALASTHIGSIRFVFRASFAALMGPRAPGPRRSRRHVSVTSAVRPIVDCMLDQATDCARSELASHDGMRRVALRYGPELRRYAARRVRSRSLADDVVQEMWLRAWRSADQFDPDRGSLRRWLFAILRNVLVDFARQQACRPLTSPLRPELPAIGDADGADAVVGSLALSAAIRQLTVQHREVIYHGHMHERSQHEIAELLGVPVGTVRSRLFYARQALRRVLVEGA
jgi:RNA polymerase sigma-70 factor (ECF subfamily)